MKSANISSILFGCFCFVVEISVLSRREYDKRKRKQKRNPFPNTREKPMKKSYKKHLRIIDAKEQRSSLQISNLSKAIFVFMQKFLLHSKYSFSYSIKALIIYGNDLSQQFYSHLQEVNEFQD